MGDKIQSQYTPEEKEALSRLFQQHAALKYAMGDKLLLAPLNMTKPLKILDVGTADGTKVTASAAYSLTCARFTNREIISSRHLDP